VVSAHPVLITEKQKTSKTDVSCVCMDQLAVIRTPEDLIASA
jgi:hypothetical protein